MELVISALVGSGVGIVVGALGAGGGILAVPALVYALGQSPHDAAAGSLVIVLVASLSALLSRARRAHVNWRSGLLFGAVSAVGAIGGARLAPLLPPTFLMILFSVLLTSTAAVMFVRGARVRAQENHTGCAEPGEMLRTTDVNALALIGAAGVVGVLAGVFGVGGGFAVVPLLVAAFGFSMAEATATSVFVMLLSAAFGLIGRIGTPVCIDWPVILVFAASSAAAGALGGPLTRRARPSTLIFSFSALLAITAALTAWLST